ncbi:MAG: methyltransferase domain-containing protein [Planctomycetota bacterium]|nr:methyltransferase domain-containing protein [Planctomycetota bacterium]
MTLAPSPDANTDVAESGRLSGESLSGLFAREWYYSIELKPGQISPGAGHPSVSLTRQLVARSDVQGARCLDIGCMEGLISTLMAARGAEVTSIDDKNKVDQIRAVQSAFGVTFRYLPGIASMHLLDRLEQDWNLQYASRDGQRPGSHPDERWFDVVVCSGVLYHVWSPLHVLGAARSLVRPGGLLIVETAAIHSPRAAMTFNFDGTNYIYAHPSNTWFPSDTLLDHQLRMLKLEPLDCVHLGAATPDSVIRAAIVCRAVDHMPATGAEPDMEAMTRNYEFIDLVPLRHFKGAAGEPVGYRPGPWKRVMRPDIGTCDVHQTFKAQPQYAPEPSEMVLRLGDVE